MSFQLRLREVSPTFAHQPQGSNSDENSQQWEVEAATRLGSVRTRLKDPFGRSTELGEKAEGEVRWFLERYANEPFETTRADLAAESLSNYGRDLAAQIAETGQLPKYGDIHLEIASGGPGGSRTDSSRSRRTLQQLHWEVLEDARVWPSGYSFNSISVIRSVIRTGGQEEIVAGYSMKRKFKILLVVSRPGQQSDVDYQLVSRSLVTIIDDVAKNRPDPVVSLKVLRPPTWEAFQMDLHENNYDLVHFDMRGQIRKSFEGHAVAVLEFSKPHYLDSLKMAKDFRAGNEIGKELAQAGVKTVILNACESARFDASGPESNLAEVLLGHGIQHVLAMAYKVVEEAVELFMSAFYQSLLVNGTSVESASRIARLGLIRNRQRRAIYMYNVNLSDHIVPVLYTSVASGSPLSQTEGAKADSTTLSYLDKTLTSIKSLSPLKQRGTMSLDSVGQVLMGRDIDILSLESVLAASRLVLLNGQGGCGKSEFLRHACQWWQASGWIKGSAYVDFRDGSLLSWQACVDQICTQLGIGPDERSGAAIIDTLRAEKYLLVFDSADAFESLLLTEPVVYVEALTPRLRSLIDKASSDGSMVIVASRLDTTQVANITSDRQKYRLSGLSIIDSVTLLQRLAIGDKSKPPETYHRRDNIDFLRRVAILLEGNPTAIQMIVPAFKRANYDGKVLFNNLLYNAIEEPSEDAWSRSHFVQSLTAAMVLPSFINFDESLIQATHFAPFWNLMPKNLNYYYWFFYLFASKYFQEAAYANWISKEWQDVVNNGRMALTLGKHWPEIESKLIGVGILQHATITRRDASQVPCYHVNPVYTLLSRSSIGKAAWKEARFAYIRQALLWNRQHSHEGSSQSEWTSVIWDGMEQHEDHLHNWYVQAIGWTFEDGDPQEQIQRMGVSLFSLIYNMSVGSWWTKPRQSRLLIPHIRGYLSRTYAVTDLSRPASVPTSSDLNAILSYSWALYQIDTEDTMQSSKAPIVKLALEAVDRWRAASPPATALPPPDEVSWFQLRFAEARIMDRSLYLREAKELFERNLADDPATTDGGMLNIIKRWHLRNLQHWADCVIRLAVRDGIFDKEEFNSHMQAVSNIFEQKSILPAVSELLSENPEAFNTFKVRDQIHLAIKFEEQAVSKFGKLAKHIIESPMVNVFADLEEETGISFLNFMRQTLASNTPETAEFRSICGDLESSVHLLAGDTAAAGRAVNSSVHREAPSSVTSTGWENIAELHMYHYGLAVMRTDKPDYKKGLTHLQEWWRLHQGIDIWKQDQVWGLLKLAACYHALGHIAEACREVIKCVEIGQRMGPDDCLDSNVAAAHRHIYEMVADLDQLEVFLDPMVIFSQSPRIAELSLKERVQLQQIIRTAHEVKREGEKREKLLEQMAEISRLIKHVKEQGLLPNLGTDHDNSINERIEELAKSRETRSDSSWFF